jgi:hypothetical protein
VKRALSKLAITLKALQQLGLGPVSLNAWYKFGLHSGWLRWSTNRAAGLALAGFTHQTETRLTGGLLSIPSRGTLESFLSERERDQAVQEADEIIHGSLRLYGRTSVPFNLSENASQKHWTELEQRSFQTDIKDIWEPARFGWVCTLARAYCLTQADRYPQAFWEQFEAFQSAHPAYLGPHWVSAQEVALRLLGLVLAGHVFADAPSSTLERMNALGMAVALHAARIPATISYARSQNNNHLLSEAVGLFTAGLALPSHKFSQHWKELGWSWLQRGLLSQISSQGEYIQHSSNYHRLMLQLALWVNALMLNLPDGENPGYAWSEVIRKRLAASTQWLAALLDHPSGQVPNLGPNDGAYILPFAGSDHTDYRPVLQAASLAFCEQRLLPEGSWDEMSCWFGLETKINTPQETASSIRSSHPATIRHPSESSWGYLRTAIFTSRPGHADQLHCDLWWQGLNIALDPGTYRYTAPPPWDNTLTHTAVHNTLTVDGLEQMNRTGRFLYLDWAQAELRLWSDFGEMPAITARHNGYRRLGILHERCVQATQQGWKITDQLLPMRSTKHPFSHHARLHWLLPDWPYEIEGLPDGVNLTLNSPLGPILLEIKSPILVQLEGNAQRLKTCLVRAGQCAYGDDPKQPTWGWIARSYAHKEPALSLAVESTDKIPLTFETQWIFPTQDKF